MNGFLERLPKLTSEEIKNFTIPLCIKEMEFVVKSLPTEKNSRSKWLHRWILPTYMEEITSILYKLLQKIEVYF